MFQRLFSGSGAPGRYVPGGAEYNPHLGELYQQRRAAVGEERQGYARTWHQVRHDGDVQYDLYGQQGGNPGRDQEGEAVAHVQREIVAAHDESREQQQDGDSAGKAQLLADHGEDEVVVLLRQVQVGLPPLPQPQAEEAAGADGIKRLHDLVPVPARVGKGVEPG